MNLNFLVISCLALTLGLTSESIAIGRIQPRRVRREIGSPTRIHGSQQVRFARKVLDTDLENAQGGYFPIWLSGLKGDFYIDSEGWCSRLRRGDSSGKDIICQ